MKDELQQLAVNIDQAAEMLGLHPQTVRRLILDGEIRHSRVGKRYLIEIDELHRFLRRTRQ